MAEQTCILKLNTGEEILTKTDLDVDNPILSKPLKFMVTGVNKNTGQAMVDLIPFIMGCPEAEGIILMRDAIITIIPEEFVAKQMLDEYLQRTTKIQLA